MNTENSVQTYMSPPDINLLSATFRGDNDATFAELLRLAELVGVDLTRLSSADRRDGVLRLSDAGAPNGYVRAEFHPLFAQYFATGEAFVDVRKQSEKILDLFVAVGATIRGKVLGVVGAHGGVGTSTLAACMARMLAREGETVALVDANPASAGIELLLSMVGSPGKRWADVQGKGALLAGSLNDSLPNWHGVRVLSADERGAAPDDAELTVAAVAAVAQMNTWTVVDLPTVALIPAARAYKLIEWCDYLLVLTHADGVHLSSTHSILSHLDRKLRVSVVAMNVRSKNEAAHVAQTLAVRFVHPVRFERNHSSAVEHGVNPADRQRSGFSRDVRRVCSHVTAAVQ